MCLIAFAIGAHPACPLLLAGNRDEFFDRPTEPLHRWPDSAAVGIWAGRDRRDGGTWLGVSETGRVALLTNVRSASPGLAARSRGELATRWLRGDADADTFARELDPAAYGGFNLVVGDLRRGAWTWLCNRNPADPHADTAANLHRQTLAPGLYGLSNAVLDTPWPKTRRLKSALARAVQQADAQDPWRAPLEAALADDRTQEPEDLPATGVAADWERALSSPFVRTPERGYGTRSSLILRVLTGDRGQRVDLHEWTHSPAGWSTQGPVHHQLAW